MSPETESRWIELDGIRVRFLTSGNGGTRVLLLHGGSGDSASLSWGPTLQILSSVHCCAAPDLPGFGLSDKPSVEYTLGYYTRFVHRFLAGLQWQRCTVVGLSMGGQIAANFALISPEAVEKLGLVSCAGLGTELHWRVLSRLMVKTPRLQKRIRNTVLRRREISRLVLLNLVHDPGVITEAILKELAAGMRLPGAGRAWRSYLKHEMRWSGFRHNLLSRLPQLQSPTLLIHGANDKLIPAKWARRALARLPRGELHLLQNCGHWPQREQPEKFHSLLLDFLDRTTAAGPSFSRRSGRPQK